MGYFTMKYFTKININIILDNLVYVNFMRSNFDIHRCLRKDMLRLSFDHNEPAVTFNSYRNAMRSLRAYINDSSVFYNLKTTKGNVRFPNIYKVSHDLPLEELPI